MAGHGIAIVGAPGTGKTFGVKHLNPDEVKYYNCDRKPLTFKGAKNYSKEKGNYSENYLLNPTQIGDKIYPSVGQSILEDIKNPKIKIIIVDTVNSLLNYKEFLSGRDNKSGSMTQSQWYDLSKDTFQLVAEIQAKLRDDMFCFYLFHEKENDGLREIKTNGRKLDEVSVAGLFNTVLFTKVTTVNGEPDYKLITSPNDECIAKQLEQCFNDKLIDNNYQIIVDAIRSW